MRVLRSLGFAGVLAFVVALDIAALGEGRQLDVQLVAAGLVAPVDLTFSPDGSDRRFIVDQTGLVLILTSEGNVLSTPFLDITDRVVIQSAFAAAKSGFMKSIGQDADGELYAVTGKFTPTGLQGRIWKIIDASD